MAPDLVQVYHKNRSSGVIFISLTEESRDDAQRFARDYGVEWPLCSGARSFLDGWLGEYTYPGFLIIGRDGKIAWSDGGSRQQHGSRRFGIDELDYQLDRIVGRPAGSTQKSPRQL